MAEVRHTCRSQESKCNYQYAKTNDRQWRGKRTWAGTLIRTSVSYVEVCRRCYATGIWMSNGRWQ